MKQIIALLLIAASAFALSSCRTPTDTDNSVPWNRPAQWEGGIPGMGTMPNQGAPR